MLVEKILLYNMCNRVGVLYNGGVVDRLLTIYYCDSKFKTAKSL